jgi:hypothetical protein
MISGRTVVRLVAANNVEGVINIQVDVHNLLLITGYHESH